MTTQAITTESAIRQTIDQLNGPPSWDEVAQHVLAIVEIHDEHYPEEVLY